MTRRFADFSRPRPAAYGRLDWFYIGLAVVGGLSVTAIAIGILVMAAIAVSQKANAHESWINRGGFKNAAGEWCCGDYDCKTYSKSASSAAGWLVEGELVPYDEALPIAPPDGLVTICRRPDGTRRCVFGVKPGL